MKRKKVIRLVVLMVFSQLVLTLFVGWWLYSQYDKEKKALSFDISRKFKEAEQQVADSVLFIQYIKPLTTDSLHLPKKFSFKRVETYGAVSTSDSLEKDRSFISLEINDSPSIHRHINTDTTIFIEPNPTMMKEMVVGLKMFIEQTPGDSGVVQSQFRAILESHSDLFQQVFQKKMNAMGLKTTWLNKAPKEREKHKGIFFHSSQFNNIASVQVLGYERNAFNRIWPQMIFGTLLVLLTATSFLIAYRSIRSQQKLNRLREDFISNISHELKTPLSTAKVTIEALKTFDDQKRAAVMHEYLDIADNELERLDELVTKVLHTGMLENENGFLRPRETDLTTLVQEVLMAFKTRTRDKKADIQFEPKGPVILSIDPLHIQGVLYNLLDNALKYNQDEIPRINIEIEEKGNEVLLEVSDNGPGIPADYRDKVFDKFFRVPSGDVHNIKGHGLGLSYTRQVMLKHGGKVTVQNNSPRGSMFTLYFSKNEK